MYFRQCIVCVVLERAPKIIPAICTPHFAESIFQAHSKAYFPDQAICSTVSRGFIEYLLFLLLPQNGRILPQNRILPFLFYRSISLPLTALPYTLSLAAVPGIFLCGYLHL